MSRHASCSEYPSSLVHVHRVRAALSIMTWQCHWARIYKIITFSFQESLLPDKLQHLNANTIFGSFVWAPLVKYDNLSKGKEIASIKELQKQVFPGQLFSGEVPLIQHCRWGSHCSLTMLLVPHQWVWLQHHLLCHSTLLFLLLSPSGTLIKSDPIMSQKLAINVINYSSMLVT